MSAAAASTAGTARGSWLKVAVVMAVVLLLDQVTKAIVRGDVAVGERNEVLPFLSIGHVHNDGVAFGFLGGGGTIVLVIVLAAITALVVFFARNAGRPLMWLPTGLLLGGALGNLIDRVHQGYVTDFIQLPSFPSFNVADMAVTFGVIALVIVLELNARAQG
ncbi:signal peptidase II [Conexibacter arvalis]|uniref:Lipoprotein signal peptidase n=1 Tax=Conexibacter arvalis TaxID=912552 RepID=A0A840IHE7_9ACTN|nr:signal peptidase II [Conexibacter arvalis]MBB4663651.1 signal peptidase II [Conexibacter arvalis]